MITWRAKALKLRSRALSAAPKWCARMRASAATEGYFASVATSIALRVCRRAMAPPLSMAGSGSDAVGSLITQATMERLIFRLDELDRQGGYAPTLMPGSSRTRLEALIPGAVF
jgi:hypothetical protein